MRLDKFTTKFQEALSEAQTIALKHDNAYIEPVHVLAAMLALMFAAFILLCGATHWLDLATLWAPVYGLQGLVKAAVFGLAVSLIACRHGFYAKGGAAGYKLEDIMAGKYGPPGGALMLFRAAQALA